jgi:DNA-binding response OmpR family regulator
MERVALIDSLGADEVLFKPVDPKEFSCRIGILLRRHRKRQSAPSIDRRAQFRRKADVQRLQKAKDYSRSKVQIDDERKLVRLGDRSIALTPKEYRLFCLLASEAGRVFSANEIISHLWENRRRVSVGDVQQYVYLLRKKVEYNIHQPQWIETVKGFGYRLNPVGT